jgi:hypothetical protein
MIVNEIRKWINVINELNNDDIRYFGPISKEEDKWLIRTGRKCYSSCELRPIFINIKMVGGISWNLGGIDYIECKPEFQGIGVLRKVLMDNLDNGVVKFVTASDELVAKLNNYGNVIYDPETDISSVMIDG